MTEEALDVVCRNVDQVQEYLRRAILVENPSTYLRWRHSTIPEWEFLVAVAGRTGCGILCDVNNIYVSARNLGADPYDYFPAMVGAPIGEIHLAGHAVRQLDDGQEIRIDDHGATVALAVWALYAHALSLFGQVPTLIEWDTGIPAFAILEGEADQAQRLLDRHGASGVNHTRVA
jgi:hypothetical protein